MQAFKKMSAEEKTKYRRQAAESIRRCCETSGMHGIITAHFCFWEEGAEDAGRVWTKEDGETHERRAADETRDREPVSVEHLKQWQDLEMKELREVFYGEGIPFMAIQDDTDVEAIISAFIEDDAADGENNALKKLTEWTERRENEKVDTWLVIDADKTLAAQDSGLMLCQTVGQADALKTLFRSSLQYSAAAFYQAMLCYEEMVKEQDRNIVCDTLAQKIKIHPVFTDILLKAAGRENVDVVIVTCGIGGVWEKVLKIHGLSKAMTVIGGGRLKDRIGVTPEVKQRIVQFLQTEQDAIAWAFGDSQLDLPMLKQADQAVVVVCDEKKRSKSMDEELTLAITEQGLYARQMLVPPTVSPRLDGSLLPVVHPADISFEVPLSQNLQIIHANNRPACKMLAAPTRSRDVAGLELQESHRRVGYYLAAELLPKATGLEELDMITVQGTPSKGHRIRNESKTVVVSMMRAGDALAQGVFEALPSAVYIHGHEPSDLENRKHVRALKEAKTILLCDFVINNGCIMISFVEEIREKLNETARIVMVAGVVQIKAMSQGGGLIKGLEAYAKVSVVVLRMSVNHFKGHGERETDTGGRLFNTTEVGEAEEPE